MSRKKILYILNSYPQISETYIKVEIEALHNNYELEIISLNKANYSFENPHPYHNLSEYRDILAVARQFQPDVIHTHWMSYQLETVYRLAKDLKVPFSVRSHSFDTLWKKRVWYRRMVGQGVPKKVHRFIHIVNDPLCLGVLGFPFVIPRLQKAGVRKNKLVEAGPVVAYDMFHNEEPNGNAIINVGACLPKKRYEDYIHLASLMPEREFNLYALGYLDEKIKQVNQKAGSPVNMHLPIQQHEMAAKLKDHQWMVYTADPVLATVGWPLSLAEAQAAGVGVCMRRLRPDLEDYLGGSAILYDSIEELVDILKNPVPEAMRRQGFNNAKRFDIKAHIHLLTDLWRVV